jgi:hypothetical protein
MAPLYISFECFLIKSFFALQAIQRQRQPLADRPPARFAPSSSPDFTPVIDESLLLRRHSKFKAKISSSERQPRSAKHGVLFKFRVVVGLTLTTAKCGEFVTQI